MTAYRQALVLPFPLPIGETAAELYMQNTIADQIYYMFNTANAGEIDFRN